MRYCIDTWFLHQLFNNSPKAMEIFRRCQKGKVQLFVPVVVLTEFRVWCIRTGLPDEAVKLAQGFQRTDKATLAGIDFKTAWLAGELRGTFNTPTVDALIAATAIVHKCHALLSGDGHFEILHQQGRLKVKNW